jgi:hypothetical protein
MEDNKMDQPKLARCQTGETAARKSSAKTLAKRSGFAYLRSRQELGDQLK